MKENNLSGPCKVMGYPLLQDAKISWKDRNSNRQHNEITGI